MDFEEMIHNAMQAERAQQMANSDQLTLIELINKLEAVKNKSLPIEFDNGKAPSCLGSWRGSYAELYIGFDGDTNSYNGTDVEYEYPEHGITGYNEVPANLPASPSAQDVLELCQRCLGKSFVGYKGGNYTMGKLTPVWVSQYGTSGGFEYGDPDIFSTKVVGVTELPDKVVIDTKGENY